MSGNPRLFSEGEFTVRILGNGHVPAEVLAESIQGWSGIYRRVPAVLAQHHPAFGHMRLVLFVETVDEGSKIIRTLARLFIAPEHVDKVEADVAEWLDKSKNLYLENIKHMNADGKTVVSLAVGSMLTIGMMKIVGCLEGEDKIIVENSKNTIINQGALYYNTTPQRYFEKMQSAARDKAKLTRQSLAAFRPSSSLSDGAVEIGDGSNAVLVEKNAARILSRVNYEDLQPTMGTRRLTNTVVSIRALDLDRKKSGWAGVFPDVSTKRCRISLASDVKISEPGTYIVDASVDVIVDLDGNVKPKAGHLIRMRDR